MHHLSPFRNWLRQILTLALVALIQLSGMFFVFGQPSYAASSSSAQLNSEEKLDRAFDGFSEGAGQAESIYQERLNEGQDPEKMPKPFKRIQSLENKNKEVPATSLLETTVSRVREFADTVTNQE